MEPIKTMRCDACGKTKHLSEFYSRRGRNTFQDNCQACTDEIFRSVNSQGGHDPRQYLLDMTRFSAHQRGIEHCLALEDIPLPTTCKYLGTVLEYRTPNGKDKPSKHCPNAASVDRIDSNKGYISGNIQVISAMANNMKYTATVEQLVTFARNILRVHTLEVPPRPSS